MEVHMTNRFSIVSDETITKQYNGTIEVIILRDNNTGINYLLTQHSSYGEIGSGLTPLLDPSGHVIRT